MGVIRLGFRIRGAVTTMLMTAIGTIATSGGTLIRSMLMAYDLALADEHRERWSTFTPLHDYFNGLFNGDRSRDDYVHAPVKEPNDSETPSFVSRVQAKFHDLSNDTFNRRYTLARGWETSKHLRVRTSLQFFNLDGAEMYVDQ